MWSGIARASQLAGEEIRVRATDAASVAAIGQEHFGKAVYLTEGTEPNPEFAIFALDIGIVAGKQHRRLSEHHGRVSQAALPTSEPSHFGIVGGAFPGAPGCWSARIDDPNLGPECDDLRMLE